MKKIAWFLDFVEIKAILKYFSLVGNEIKHVEKQRKLLQFFTLC